MWSPGLQGHARRKLARSAERRAPAVEMKSARRKPAVEQNKQSEELREEGVHVTSSFASLGCGGVEAGNDALRKGPSILFRSSSISLAIEFP